MRRTTLAVAVALAVVAGVSCDTSGIIIRVGGEPDTLFVVSAGDSSVTVEQLVLEVGDTARLSAGALNSLGQYLGDVAPVWSSLDPSIASVSSAGEVVGESNGSTTVMVAYSGLTYSVPTVVFGPEIEVRRPTATILSPSRDTTITLGDALTVRGQGADADGTVVAHSWRFGDGDSATVQNPTPHTYGVDRTFEVTYVVTDDDGLQSSPARREITVIDPADPPPPPDTTVAGTVFVADWDQGTGTGSTAFTDGGQFVDWGGGAGTGGLEVRSTAAEGRDYSTQNFLAIQMVDNQDWVDMISRNWATPQVGQTVTARWEMRWTSPIGGQTTHGFYFDPDFGGTNWGPPTLGLSIEDNAVSWQATVWTSSSATPDLGPIQIQQAYPLSKSTTYVLSLSYTRTSSTEFTVGFEIRNLAGNLLYDSGDFADYGWYSGSRSLATTTFTQDGAGAAGMRGFRVGNNGLDVRASANQAIAEVANLQVTISDP